jgi:hypothetical protein
MAGRHVWREWQKVVRDIQDILYGEKMIFISDIRMP